MEKELDRRLRGELFANYFNIELTVASLSKFDEELVRSKIDYILNNQISDNERIIIKKKKSKANFALAVIQNNYGSEFDKKYLAKIKYMCNESKSPSKKNNLVFFCENEASHLAWELSENKELYEKAFKEYQTKYKNSTPTAFNTNLSAKLKLLLFNDFKSGKYEDISKKVKKLLIENEGNVFVTIKKLSEELDIDYDKAEEYVNTEYKKMQNPQSNNVDYSYKTNIPKKEETHTITVNNYGSKCPNCGSNYVKKIGVINRTVSIGLWGLASSKIGKTMQCNKCGYKW